MTLDDLNFIFENQLKTGEKLYYMLVDNDYRVIERHIGELSELLPMLAQSVYGGDAGGVPRFIMHS